MSGNFTILKSGHPDFKTNAEISHDLSGDRTSAVVPISCHLIAGVGK